MVFGGRTREAEEREKEKETEEPAGAAESWGCGVKKRKVEKERVRNVKDRYEQLSAALGDLVESGRFSKVRILGTAIHRLEKLR